MLHFDFHLVESSMIKNDNNDDGDALVVISGSGASLNNESMTEAGAMAKVLGRSFQCIGKLYCRATDKWRVINAEVAETQRKTLKTLRPLRLCDFCV